MLRWHADLMFSQSSQPARFISQNVWKYKIIITFISFANAIFSVLV